MFFLETKLITGIIFKFIKSIIVGIFKFFKLLNLHVTLIIGIAGLITYLAGGFSIVYVKYSFYALITASFLISILVSIKKGGKSKKSRGNVQIVNEKQSENLFEKEEKTEIKIKTENYPKYFRVANRPNYVFAEHVDRYELYVIENNKMRLVRVDKKG